ncbi:MAG: transcription termination/antitermination protein NusG [Gammaproteobacteria bacterium]|nr:transcription termination/antitermination protein NusG [Gammaproteobacteria bacterium]
MSMRWYVVHAFSGFEKKVQAEIRERASREGLADKFGDILVPVEEVVEMRNGQKTNSQRMFYPGYVLVQMEMDDVTWHLVKSTPRVTGFVGGSVGRPHPLSDAETNAIMDRIKEGVGKPRPKFSFDAGEQVRVVDGPFKDFNGVVEEVNFEKSKLRVSVTIFGRSTPVELDFGQVEKA